MKTKERILIKALDLFNEKGIKYVTLRQIASSLNISQGNLNYHFKVKDEIISKLYYKLVEQMDHEMNKINQDKPILSYLSESALVSMNIMFQYRFITQDLYHILENNIELKHHYIDLQRKRKIQYLQLFQRLIKTGIMRPEELTGEYERLYERMNILGDNWINAAIFFKNNDKSKVLHYHALLFEVIYPYLTTKGKLFYLEECDHKVLK